MFTCVAKKAPLPGQCLALLQRLLSLCILLDRTWVCSSATALQEMESKCTSQLSRETEEMPVSLWAHPPKCPQTLQYESWRSHLHLSHLQDTTFLLSFLFWSFEIVFSALDKRSLAVLVLITNFTCCTYFPALCPYCHFFISSINLVFFLNWKISFFTLRVPSKLTTPFPPLVSQVWRMDPLQIILQTAPASAAQVLYWLGRGFSQML